MTVTEQIQPYISRYGKIDFKCNLQLQFHFCFLGTYTIVNCLIKYIVAYTQYSPVLMSDNIN